MWVTFPIGLPVIDGFDIPSTREGSGGKTASQQEQSSDRARREGFASVRQFIFQGAEFMPLLLDAEARISRRRGDRRVTGSVKQ